MWMRTRRWVSSGCEPFARHVSVAAAMLCGMARRTSSELARMLGDYNRTRAQAVGFGLGGLGAAGGTYGYLKYKTGKAQRMKRKYAKQRKAREAYEASRREGQQHLDALNSGKLDHLVGKSWRSKAKTAKKALTYRRNRVRAGIWDRGITRMHGPDKRMIREELEHAYKTGTPPVDFTMRNKRAKRPMYIVDRYSSGGYGSVKYSRLPLSAEIGLGAAGAAGAYGVSRKVRNRKVKKSWRSSARSAGRSAQRALTHRRAKVQWKVDGKWKKAPGGRDGRRIIRNSIENDYNNYSPRVLWRSRRFSDHPASLERAGHQRVKYARLPVSAEVGLAGAGAAGAYGVHRKVKKDMSVPLSQISKMRLPKGAAFQAFSGHSKLARQRGAVQAAAAKVRAKPGSARARKRLARKTDRYMATSSRTSAARTGAADRKWGKVSGHNRDDYLTDKRSEFQAAHGRRRAVAATQGDDWL